MGSILALRLLILLITITITITITTMLVPIEPKCSPLEQHKTWLIPVEIDIEHEIASRDDFPLGFVFGTASASYQYEGAVTEGGRTFSIWDNFTHQFPEKSNGSNGDVTIDFYHRYKEDIQLMKKMNLDAFRFSISWSRILPYGKISRGVSIDGILFYKNLIHELKANNIKSFVTIFHWDLPQTLEDDYKGFLSRDIIEDYRQFASLCFKLYGDMVDVWSTFNEPWVFSVASYDKGIKAPGRCSPWRNYCAAGNSSTEPYTVAHHLLLSHVAAVEEFRKCDICKNGKIGIVLCPRWYKPYDSSNPNDTTAVERSIDFDLGWHLNPLTYGDYPPIMRKIVGNRLPNFSEPEKKSLINSFDYIGINYYGAFFAKDTMNVYNPNASYTADVHADWLECNASDQAMGPPMASQIPVFPIGIRYILNHTKHHYKDPSIYITENGYDRFNWYEKISKHDIYNDWVRVRYHKEHLTNISVAIRDDDVKVHGYFVWSFLDNFEWNAGYAMRFGLYYIDYFNNLARSSKRSGDWFKKFLRRNVTEKASIDNVVHDKQIFDKR